jgi:hypothetical protein
MTDVASYPNPFATPAAACVLAATATEGPCTEAADDSCFPGWYRGRAIHIHYSVSLNGQSYTSQLVFDQTLIDEVFTTHAEYKGYGLPDTPNANDNVVSGGDPESFTLATSRMTDGAMLASKQLVVDV